MENIIHIELTRVLVCMMLWATLDLTVVTSGLMLFIDVHCCSIPMSAAFQLYCWLFPLSIIVIMGSAKKSCWPACSCRPLSPVNLLQNKIGAEPKSSWGQPDKVLKWSQCQAAWPNRWWKILKAWRTFAVQVQWRAMACHPSSRLASEIQTSRPLEVSLILTH